MKDSGYGSSTFGEKIEDSEKHLSYGSATNSEDEVANAHDGKHEITKSEETGVRIRILLLQASLELLRRRILKMMKNQDKLLLRRKSENVVFLVSLCSSWSRCER